MSGGYGGSLGPSPSVRLLYYMAGWKGGRQLLHLRTFHICVGLAEFLSYNKGIVTKGLA